MISAKWKNTEDVWETTNSGQLWVGKVQAPPFTPNSLYLLVFIYKIRKQIKQ